MELGWWAGHRLLWAASSQTAETIKDDRLRHIALRLVRPAEGKFGYRPVPRGIIQRPSISARNSSTQRSCWRASSLARFSFNLLKNSRLRFSWLSRPRRTSPAIALLILRINRLGVPLHLIGETGGQSDRISRFDFAPTLSRLFPAAAAAFNHRLRRMRHASSG